MPIYYVRTDGSDLNTGLSDSAGGAFASVAKASLMVSPGDTVYVRAGVYSEAVKLSTSGTALNPITWIGERSGPSWLTIIDPGVGVSSGWVAAPEVGSGVYKHTSFPFIPGCITDANRQISQISPWGEAFGGAGSVTSWPGSLFWELKRTANDSTTYNVWRLMTIYYWGSLQAAWGYWSGTVYLRYRNGDNPNGKSLKATIASRVGSNPTDSWVVTVQVGGTASYPDGASVRLTGAYNVFRDFHVRGSNSALAITGSSCVGNQVHDNLIEHGGSPLHISFGASENLVYDNTIRGGRLFADFGAWAGTQASAPYSSLDNNAWGYGWHKRYEATPTFGLVDIYRAGNGNKFYGNALSDSSSGLGVSDYVTSPVTENTEIYDNTFDRMSSAAIALAGGDYNTRVFGNRVTNANFLVRFQNFSTAQPVKNRRQFFYRNTLNNPRYYGIPMYFHLGAGSAIPDLWIYHNTIHGGFYSALFTTPAVDTGYSGVRVFNNVLQSASESTSSGPFRGLPWVAGALSRFDNNLYTGTVTATWKGTGNLDNRPYQWTFSDPSVGVIDETFDMWEAGRAKPEGEPDSVTLEFNAWDIGSHEFVEGGAPPSTPPVYIQVLSPGYALQAGLVPVSFRLTRVGSTSGNLSVDYSVAGSAAPGEDYEALSGTATIPDASDHVDVVVQPLAPGSTVDETVDVTISPGAGYTVANPSAVSITIRTASTASSSFLPNPGQLAVRRFP